ncbi:MAG: M23 family metallopeptidase [Acidobacteria bacterium]|nr:M23 family metallopeptidase [Acidobacteriota bacterium]
MAAMLVAAAGLAAGLAAAPSTSSAPEVVPGGVVRWGGAAVERCGLGDARWQPLEGLCLYPVDLNSTGTVTLRREVAGRWQTTAVRVAKYPYPEQRLTIQDDSKVHLSQPDIDRSRRESARVGALWHHPSERQFTLPLAPPLSKLPEDGRFGSRRLFNGEPRSPHTGADYAANTGTPVKAVAAGKVVLAEEHFFSGNSVFIDHGDELVSMYFHLSEIDVAPGDRVERGQLLGKVGATGRVTGPHLHFGLRWHGARIDPKALLGPVAALPEAR